MNKIPKSKLSTQYLSDIHNYNCNIKTREIFLHGYYGSGDEVEQGIDFRPATILEKNIRLLDNEEENILIHMHTIGGEWNDGMGIFDSIITCQSPTIIFAYSVARSMSSIILQAADVRVLMPNCEFMIHNGYIEGSSTYSAFLSEARMEKARQYKMLEIYAKQCINGKYFKEKGFNIEKIIKFLNKQINTKGDWWLFADDAVNFGFADGIFGTPNYSSLEEIRAKTKNKASSSE